MVCTFLYPTILCKQHRHSDILLNLIPYLPFHHPIKYFMYTPLSDVSTTASKLLTLTVNPATYMLYSIYPDDKVLIGSNKVIRTEFISQPRDRREKSISGQYISIFSRRLFWQKQSITHIILGPPRQILQIIGSSDISSFEPLHSN